MVTRTGILSGVAFALTVVTLALRATTVHSTGAQPLIYRATVSVNDLDSIEGLATPGRWVEVFARQRNFKEGEDGTGDPFDWCRWKNGGNAYYVGGTWTAANGVFTLKNLRASGNTVPIFPPAPGEDRCLGGLYTELQVVSCDGPSLNCTQPAIPTLHWLNVRHLVGDTGVVMGSVSGGDQVAAAIADGPNGGPNAPGLIDVDQNGVDTTTGGFTPGQRVTWRCGAGGTQSCPSVSIQDSSTALANDPEYPFLLGTIQAHRPGGSIIAAAEIPRGADVGFAVNVNVRFRGRLDINLGCDRKSFFDFS